MTIGQTGRMPGGCSRARSPIQVDERRSCLEKLFLNGEYDLQPNDDESTVNMAARYLNIEEAFPEEIKGAAFPYFLDWLKYNVILVEITAYSDDNAYTIFESMNDRGLNLTSTEMLKGYILSRFSEPKDREKANRFWRDSIQSLIDPPKPRRYSRLRLSHLSESRPNIKARRP